MSECFECVGKRGGERGFSIRRHLVQMCLVHAWNVLQCLSNVYIIWNVMCWTAAAIKIFCQQSCLCIIRRWTLNIEHRMTYKKKYAKCIPISEQSNDCFNSIYFSLLLLFTALDVIDVHSCPCATQDNHTSNAKYLNSSCCWFDIFEEKEIRPESQELWINSSIYQNRNFYRGSKVIKDFFRIEETILCLYWTVLI